MSPQLLLLSGIGDATQLQAVGVVPRVQLAGVGEALQDHLIFPLTLLVNGTTAVTDPRPSSSVSHVMFHRSVPSLTAPDIEVTMQADLWDGSLQVPPNADIVTLGVAHNHPLSRGRISLRSNSPFDPPVIEPNYFNSSDDVDALIAALEVRCDAGRLEPHNH